MNRYIFGIIGIAVLVFALVTVNHGITTNAQPDNDDDDQQQSQQTTKPAQPQQAAGASTATPSTPGADNSAPPDEVKVNDPSKAQYRIVAGWNFDSKNQSNSSQLNQSIQALQQMAAHSGGRVSFQAVDVDVPDSSRSATARGVENVGVTINGKPVVTGNLGEGPNSGATLMQKVGSAMSQASHP